MKSKAIIDDINEVMNREIPFLLSLSDEQVSIKRNKQNRTVKMLVGHLIDSASNNHQRIVRLQYAPRCGHSMPNTEMGMLVFPDYTQDNDLWIQLQDYQHEDWQQLVMLLKLYNQHICHHLVIRKIRIVFFRIIIGNRIFGFYISNLIKWLLLFNRRINLRWLKLA